MNFRILLSALIASGIVSACSNSATDSTTSEAQNETKSSTEQVESKNETTNEVNSNLPDTVVAGYKFKIKKVNSEPAILLGEYFNLKIKIDPEWGEVAIVTDLENTEIKQAGEFVGGYKDVVVFSDGIGSVQSIDVYNVSTKKSFYTCTSQDTFTFDKNILTIKALVDGDKLDKKPEPSEELKEVLASMPGHEPSYQREVKIDVSTGKVTETDNVECVYTE